MDKKIAGLLGAAAAIATVGSASATEVQGNPVNHTASYRELLDPVPNAVAAFKADDARRASAPAETTQVAQVVYISVGHHHHHHHHHHRVVVPRVRIVTHHHHHHHHHHHSNYYGR